MKYFFSRVLATLQPAKLVGLSVVLSFFSVFGVFGRLLHCCSCSNAWVSSLLEFHHCPCLPARDFGSRVYGLVEPGIWILVDDCSWKTVNAKILLAPWSWCEGLIKESSFTFVFCKTLSARVNSRQKHLQARAVTYHAIHCKPCLKHEKRRVFSFAVDEK